VAQEPVDYEAVLADLHAKRAAIDVAITAIEQLRSVGQAAATTVAGVAPGKPVDPLTIRDDAFFGLSIGEAAKKYLQMVKRKQTVKEIADALERGGLPHTSSNFVATVGTMIGRLAKSDSDLVRVGRGDWGLAAWYGSRRPKPEPVKKPRRRVRGAQRAAKSVASEKPAPPASNAAEGPTVRDLAEKTLREAGQPLSLSDILKRIEAASGRVVKRDTLAGMFSVAVRKSDTFFKSGPGTFGLIGQSDATLH
jgi:hypothetical protein